VNRDLLMITQDLRGDWAIKGSINASPVNFTSQNLPGAFNIADGLIPADSHNFLKRESRWHQDKPTDKQMALCRILKIQVPVGATKGQVSAAIDNKRMTQRTGWVR
jgi:hypothetical protein